MKLFKQKSPKKQQNFEQIQNIAYLLYKQRTERELGGNAEGDFYLASEIWRNPIRRQGFHFNQWRKQPYRNTVNWWEATSVERALETLVKDLKNLAFLDLLSLLSNVAILLTVITYLSSEQQRRDAEVYNAWQTITSADGTAGDGGRRRALEFLNASPDAHWRMRFPWVCIPFTQICPVWSKEDLSGVDMKGAYLVDVKLPNARLTDADLSSANLQGANLADATLHSVSFWNSDLRRANLHGADLAGAQFGNLPMQETGA